MFLTGFFISLLFLILVGGLLLVNLHAYYSGRSDYAPLVESSKSKSFYTVSILGNEFYLNHQELQQAAPYLERLSVFTPNSARLLAAGWQLTNRGLRYGLGITPTGTPMPVPGTSNEARNTPPKEETPARDPSRQAALQAAQRSAFIRGQAGREPQDPKALQRASALQRPPITGAVPGLSGGG